MPSNFKTETDNKSSAQSYLQQYISRRRLLSTTISAASVVVAQKLLRAAEPFLRSFEAPSATPELSLAGGDHNFPTVLELPFLDSVARNENRLALAAGIIKRDLECFFTHRPLQALIVRAAYPAYGEKVPSIIYDISEVLRKQSWPQIRCSDRLSLGIVKSATDTDPWKPNDTIFGIYRGMRCEEPLMVSEKFEANIRFFLAQGLSPGEAMVKWISGSLPDFLTGRDHNIPLQELQMVESYRWAYKTFKEVRQAFGEPLMELIREARAGFFNPTSERAKCIATELRKAAQVKATRRDQDLADELEDSVRMKFIQNGLHPILFSSDDSAKKIVAYLKKCIKNEYIDMGRRKQTQQENAGIVSALYRNPNQPESFLERAEIRHKFTEVLTVIKNPKIARALAAVNLDGCSVREALEQQGLSGAAAEQQYHYWRRILFQKLRHIFGE